MPETYVKREAGEDNWGVAFGREERNTEIEFDFTAEVEQERR
jgi:hypothetical protein